MRAGRISFVTITAPLPDALIKRKILVVLRVVQLQPIKLQQAYEGEFALQAARSPTSELTTYTSVSERLSATCWWRTVAFEVCVH